jgi:hypothetical protein
MSNINFSSIDEAFPVAGQDNNTQGFRDNFNSIKIALETAKGEIADLQTYTVLKASLSDNSAVINDLQGSTVSNAIYNKFYGAVHTETVASQTDIDLNNGPFQKFTLTGNATLRFNNWAALNEYAVIRIHLKSDGNGTRTPTLTTVNAGTMVFESAFPNPFTLNTNGKHKVIEAWSHDHGTNVYIRYLGEY